MATTEPNPYSPPQSIEELGSSQHPIADNHSTPLIRRNVAAAWVLFSIASCSLYIFVDLVVLETRRGAWPMLLASAALACIVSVVTRDWIIAPLCCFAGSMSGDLIAGLVVDWDYATVPQALALSAVFSAPALVLAVVMLMRRRRQLDPQH